MLRQIEDFEKHGVYGFVIHSRMGLPKNMDFLSPEMLALMRVAIEEAERPSGGYIRGFHWLDEETEKEDLPPAGDILNPENFSQDGYFLQSAGKEDHA